MKNMKRFSIFILALIGLACNTSSKPITENDLWTLNLPQGTTSLEQKQQIYNETKGELILKSTSTFTFTKEGNFKTHIQSFPDGSTRSQEYSYDDAGRVIKISGNSSAQGLIAITTYSYEGSNPLTIYTTVEGGNNFFPKIVKTYNGKTVVKEERYGSSGQLVDLFETKGNIKTHTSYNTSNEVRFKYVYELQNGREVKKTRYDAKGNAVDTSENELDAHGNDIASYRLNNGKRSNPVYEYAYLYQNDTWVIRASKTANDYGSGKTRTITTRSFKGSKNATPTNTQIMAFIKTL
ncbi:hypothetical protein ACFQ1R_11150 [Mariniflexile jejuense]|uniref:YD repeat-containing protein n=1 Tax=Mariniflexile jejuense TaxID=1173582 RepID=A0ABW3JKL7_9FLAO